MFGSVTVQNVRQPEAPSVSAASSSALPCSCITGISSRATKGKVTNIVASMMPGTAKTIGTPCATSQAPTSALRAEEQHEAEARDHRRHRERQVDEGDEERLAAEVELGDRPGGGEAEDGVERHRDGGGDQRQPDRRRGRRGSANEATASPTPSPAPREDGDQRREEDDYERSRARPRSARSRSQSGSVVAARDCAGGARRCRRDQAMSAISFASLLLLQTWTRLIARSIDERDHQHRDRDGHGAVVVELLEPDDDEQRRDLGLRTAGCRR